MSILSPAGTADLRDVTFAILMSGVGIIALAGVVAKNGIVLIDFMNRLSESGRPLREAVIEGGATRLRPVLLTAITAMIGLLPIATGVGIDFLHFGIRDQLRNDPVVGAHGLGDFLGPALQYPSRADRDPDVLLCLGKLAGEEKQKTGKPEMSPENQSIKSAALRGRSFFAKTPFFIRIGLLDRQDYPQSLFNGPHIGLCSIIVERQANLGRVVLYFKKLLLGAGDGVFPLRTTNT